MAAIVSHLLPLLLLSSSSTFASSSSSKSSPKYFTRCFAGRTNSPHLIYLAGTSAYQSLLLSSAQNLRFVYSPATSKPKVIVTPVTESQVQAAVACAAASNLRVRTRSGGHDYEGMSYSAAGNNSFITLDISGLHSVSVDGGGGTAWVQAGATLGELYYAIGKSCPTFAFPAGVCPTVGVGGHFTGGGIGTLMRKYGTAADNIIDARMVDAGGRLLDRKSMGEDLFWAIRGGGAASFRVVVAFRVKLVPVPPVVTVFNVVKTLEQNATMAIDRWQRVAHRFDEKLFVWVIAQAITGGGGTMTVQIIFKSLYLGRRDELLAMAEQSFPELRLTAGDCREMSWIESVLFLNDDTGEPVETLQNRTKQFNRSFKAKSDFVVEPIPASGWEKIWEFLMDSIEEQLVLYMEPFGGRMGEIEEDAIAFPHRKGNLFSIQYFLVWPEAEETAVEGHLEWMRRMYEFMGPFVSSKPRAAYYNYKDIDLGNKTKSYGEAKVWGEKYFKGNFRRLSEVKWKVDTTNFFMNEQSIPPMNGGGGRHQRAA
ncbi:Tetrahydrocannabinolic acid synthase [Apostasia shenzhenica]|uniref:Tetrahydrocannabinolic acid synthase n=1 Tax=Apostasia shenzhenica TaxID=1088818 RepID=A0A2I0BH08_9ASPA|nr:Tetrahydrocannabinolic acid synthase [Apostasia shenzhenica]